MAKKAADQQELPDDFIPKQAVPDPVINSAFVEPTHHWKYKGSVPEKHAGRRPAQYWFQTRKTGAKDAADLFAEEQADDLPLVNALRDDVRRWRNSGYRGATQVTKNLLKYWLETSRSRRLFFCQQEAVETLIYILELAMPRRLAASGFQKFAVTQENFEKLFLGEKPDFANLSDEYFPRLIDPGLPDQLALRRLGCKMATGSGKTTVMAMLISWAFCNRGAAPSSTFFPDAVLVCAPNLTVRKRLEVLKPENEDNYYKSFDLIPPAYRDYLSRGRVLVTNWHVFAPKSPNTEGGSSYKIVNKGEEPADAFTKDRLGELASRLPILVLNDEGHHCWRPKAITEAERKELERGLSKSEIEALREDEEEARVWLAGLDKINNCGLLAPGFNGMPQPGILATVDLSATPFFLGNSGYPEGSPFHWLVSDFGLIDAIECGITKVPRLPVQDEEKKVDDAGRPDPKYFRLWKNIKEQAKPTERVKNTIKPDAIFTYAQDALTTLASQWLKRFKEIQDIDPQAVPPVMIIVCDTTETSQIFFERISGQRDVDVPNPETGELEKKTIYGQNPLLAEFANSETEEVTIRIDSKRLAQLDAEGDESKDEATKRLREIIDTVGKHGKPGAKIRCVVSVSMLTEGWDANTVSHVLGVRAFGSQLLCEQVVGRGLRRRSYVPDPETGLLPAEYVDVYGIPFSLIPYKGQPKTTEGPDLVYTPVFALEERAAFVGLLRKNGQ